MIEEIRKMIAEVLEVSSADVIKTRTALLAEQATEDARYAATSALNHPEGSTTPIEEAYSRAQDRVARIRKQVEKELPKVMSLMMAMEIAEQRRAEAKLHREQGWSRPASEKDLNLNRAAVNWFPRLRRHGVHPHYLKQHSNETVAIISDLIIWKAKDATFQDPKNPWRQVLGIYARRKISKPTKNGRSGGSLPGKPMPDRHKTGSGDYRFDEMVSAEWGVSIQEVEATEDTPSEARGMPTIDCSIYPEDLTLGAVDGVVEIEPDEAEDESAPEPERVDPGMTQVLAEYALPSHIDAEGATKLRKAAEPLADDDGFDGSLFELRWAMGDKVNTLSDDEAIALVEGIPYDRLLNEQKKRQMWAAIAAGMSAAGNSINASNAGYTSGTATAFGSGGWAHAQYSGHNAAAAASANSLAQMQNQQIFDRLATTRAAGLEALKVNMRTTTIDPGRDFGGQVTFELPKEARSSKVPVPIVLRVKVGAEEHVIKAKLLPAK